MTNEKLINIGMALANLGGLKGVKFSYGVAKNINIINQEIETFKKAIEPTETFTAFENERIELCKKHAKKDENNEPILIENNYDIVDEVAFNKELDTLKVKHKKVLDEREQQLKDYSNLLKEETTVTLHKIKLADIPEEITVAQLESIYEIIEE